MGKGKPQVTLTHTTVWAICGTNEHAVPHNGGVEIEQDDLSIRIPARRFWTPSRTKSENWPSWKASTGQLIWYWRRHGNIFVQLANILKRLSRKIQVFQHCAAGSTCQRMRALIAALTSTWNCTTSSNKSRLMTTPLGTRVLRAHHQIQPKSKSQGLLEPFPPLASLEGKGKQVMLLHLRIRLPGHWRNGREAGIALIQMLHRLCAAPWRTTWDSLATIRIISWDWRKSIPKRTRGGDPNIAYLSINGSSCELCTRLKSSMYLEKSANSQSM